jgi:hypothetical protein
MASRHYVVVFQFWVRNSDSQKLSDSGRTVQSRGCRKLPGICDFCGSVGRVNIFCSQFGGGIVWLGGLRKAWALRQSASVHS